MTTDLTFFTNEPNQSLLDRFKATLPHVRYFDILVGYFRTSGFHLLYDAFADIEKIRILVGLNIDRSTFVILEEATGQLEMNFESAQQTQESFAQTLTKEMDEAPDSFNTELGVKKFIEFIQCGKLEIKAHPSQNIHAKVYISRFAPPISNIEYGKVITGSSNFSQSGLVGQHEFNVELKNRADVDYALQKFEALWAEAVDLSEAYVDTINKRTWLNDQIKPYELYLKLLYEYFKEDINVDQDLEDIPLPPGFLDLQYQRQAVISARQVLEAYNGVFLSDVVGLGKTYIAAMLAQQLPGRKLVICPPVLQNYWLKTFHQFNVSVIVESMGKLDHILRDNPNRFDYIFVDEAHRFRNEVTQSYEKLHQICWGKKVILVSATPLNNRVGDIYSQLKLFQAPKKSLIPGVKNLDRFFNQLRRDIEQYDKGTPEYTEAMKEAAQLVRNQILSHVMVRRTRKEIVTYFQDDMQRRGLTFPDLADPQRIVYTFDKQTDQIFTQTINLLQAFRYARYTPLLYLKKGVSEFEAQSQRNIGGFMKGLLVKRLESSFYAFRQSLRRFIQSYERFIEMMQEGTIYIGKDVNIYDLLDADNEERLQELIEAGRVSKYKAADFLSDFNDALQHDLTLLRQVQALWQQVDTDPKLSQISHELNHNPLLKNKKLIIFTESAETGRYLYEQLTAQFGDKVMFYRSGGGLYRDQKHSPGLARELIEENYDPNYNSPQNDIHLLISTDVLAEGINLHRSNIVINYDLPWNPTRVLQRVGRVNRVGTEHNLIYIFNCFPTAQSDEHLGLEDNIKAKIQAFHDMLGEDAKYLTDEEEVTQHELFGDRTYRRLSRKETYEGEEEETSELAYLRQIQKIRDEEPHLFEKIKRLPKKARSSRHPDPETAHPWQGDHLLTFFRKGRLKKFYLNDGTNPQELTFLDTAALLECDPDTPRLKIPQSYYDFLAANKEQFAHDTSPAADDEKSRGGGLSNEQFIITLLKSNPVKDFKGFTDDDETYLKMVREAFEAGIVPRNTSKRLRNALNQAMKGGFNPLKFLTLLKKNIPDALLFTPPQQTPDTLSERGEVILSEYLKFPD